MRTFQPCQSECAMVQLRRELLAMSIRPKSDLTHPLHAKGRKAGNSLMHACNSCIPFSSDLKLIQIHIGERERESKGTPNGYSKKEWATVWTDLRNDLLSTRQTQAHTAPRASLGGHTHQSTSTVADRGSPEDSRE